MLNCNYEPLHSAVRTALDSGLDREVILRTVSDALAQPTSNRHTNDRNPMTIYNELPAGMIDLPTAAKRYNLKRGTLGMWVRRGKLPNLGKLKAPAPGGGYTITSEAALAACIAEPPSKGGRPRKYL